jgi:vacuolar-type H+-ATPase subunit E/Vma4
MSKAPTKDEKLREAIMKVLEGEFEALPELLPQLTAKERAEFIVKLLQYVTPKPKEAEPRNRDFFDDLLTP